MRPQTALHVPLDLWACVGNLPFVTFHFFSLTYPSVFYFSIFALTPNVEMIPNRKEDIKAFMCKCFQPGGIKYLFLWLRFSQYSYIILFEVRMCVIAWHIPNTSKYLKPLVTILFQHCYIMQTFLVRTKPVNQVWFKYLPAITF